MISIRKRTRKAIKQGFKPFCFIVILFTLSFCLLAQMAMGFAALYAEQRGMDGDRISVFLEPAIKSEFQQRLVDYVKREVPSAVVTQIDEKELVSRKILEKMTRSSDLPKVLSVELPLDRGYEAVEAMVLALQKQQGVLKVTANLEWIKKRHSLRDALGIGIAAFSIPTVLLTVLLTLLSISKFNEYVRVEQRLLLMLGARDLQVRGPLMMVSALAALIGSLFGTVLYGLTTYTSIPLLEKAFEVSFMPTWQINVLICLSMTAAMTLFSVLTAYIIAGRTGALRF